MIKQYCRLEFIYSLNNKQMTLKYMQQIILLPVKILLFSASHIYNNQFLFCSWPCSVSVNDADFFQKMTFFIYSSFSVHF